MDSRPFRASRPSSQDEEPSRGQIEPSRPELVSRHDSEETDFAKKTREPSRTAKNRSWLKWLIIAIVVVVVLVGGWFAWGQVNSTYTGIDDSKYQAVFTADGQVYFGKLHAERNGYLQLTGAYYLESKSSDGAPGADNASNLQLTKLHSKIYGPGDEIIFERSQLLYFENLRDDGQVTKLIQKDLGTN